MKTQDTFSKLILDFHNQYELYSVFDDFLTMTICSLSQNPLTGKSHYEDLYFGTIKKYKDNSLRFNFPKMFACLVNQMDERMSSETGNDILGEFYSEHLYRKGGTQIFTPWQVCKFMASTVVSKSEETSIEKPLRILDPACGSGRMLVVAATVIGREHSYYGIDIDHLCVKMAKFNLFLKGVFHSEVMCANALIPEDFKRSYRLSFMPLGIFQIDKKEESPLWHILRESAEASKAESIKREEKTNEQPSNNSQLKLF